MQSLELILTADTKAARKWKWSPAEGPSLKITQQFDLNSKPTLGSCPQRPTFRSSSQPSLNQASRGGLMHGAGLSYKEVAFLPVSTSSGFHSTICTQARWDEKDVSCDLSWCPLGHERKALAAVRQLPLCKKACHFLPSVAGMFPQILNHPQWGGPSFWRSQDERPTHPPTSPEVHHSGAAAGAACGRRPAGAGRAQNGGGKKEVNMIHCKGPHKLNEVRRV